MLPVRPHQSSIDRVPGLATLKVAIDGRRAAAAARSRHGDVSARGRRRSRARPAAEAAAMNNVFESFEDLEGWHEHSAKIKAAADALVEAMKRAERFGALDTASRDAILGYVEQEIYR